MNVANVQLIGNLGADPEMRYTPSGQAVTSFSMAVNRRQRDGDSYRDVTDWYRVSCWGKTAEVADQYLKKGHRAFVSGRLSIRPYTRRDGTAGTSVEVNAVDVVMLTARGAANEAEAPVDDYADVPF